MYKNENNLGPLRFSTLGILEEKSNLVAMIKNYSTPFKRIILFIWTNPVLGTFKNTANQSNKLIIVRP